MLNALSIDVEEYFQVSGFEAVIDRNQWDCYDSRLMVGLNRVLDILAKNDLKATFFFLGWVAERYPDSVKRVADDGHEIGIHGYDHRLIYHQSPDEFEEDVTRSLEWVRKVYQGPIYGYRAPSFSVRQDTLWALEILKKLGFRYDSSIFPFKRARYGIENAPTKPYEVIPGLMEFPMSTVQVLGKTLPVAGGGYFRLYPGWLTHWAINKMNAEGRPAVVYMHPWEFDPEQPKVAADGGNSFRHRVNLAQTADKFDRLCRAFRFVPMKDVLAIETDPKDRNDDHAIQTSVLG